MEKDPDGPHISNFVEKDGRKEEKKEQNGENLSAMMYPFAWDTEQSEPIADIISENTSKREEIVEDSKGYQDKHEETISNQDAIKISLPKSQQYIGDTLLPINMNEDIIPKLLDNENMGKNSEMNTWDDKPLKGQASKVELKHKKSKTKKNSPDKCQTIKKSKNKKDPKTNSHKAQSKNTKDQANKNSDMNQKEKSPGLFNRFVSGVKNVLNINDKNKEKKSQKRTEFGRLASENKNLKQRETPYIALEEHGVKIVNDYLLEVFNDAIMREENSYQELLIEFLKNTGMQNLTRWLLNTNEKVPDLLVGTRKNLSALNNVKLVKDKAKQIFREWMVSSLIV